MDYDCEKKCCRAMGETIAFARSRTVRVCVKHRNELDDFVVSLPEFRQCVAFDDDASILIALACAGKDTRAEVYELRTRQIEIQNAIKAKIGDWLEQSS